ncbi:transcriptional regulator [Paenibacillus sp. J31TS4]|uniref:ROK family transcriptional regulator n=1 Tax=Paenibacillus sp. J31TS4 TaxID=2807195 RepID=UPI001B005BB1|nr:ROK family transcriptional regulator [Paenibacillus sp. J31TS4]GIP40817.1 transcriptional regulator [Paenibacillus sp. J31TS4]
MLTIARQPDIKQANKVRILHAIRETGETTQPELGRKLGLSRPTVSALVEELVAEGYIQFSGVGVSTDQGGKRPKLVAFHARGGGIVALHFNQYAIRGALLDLSAGVLEELRTEVLEEDSRDAIMIKLREAAGELLRKAKRLGLPVKGIGAGCPGLVETGTGTARTAMNVQAIHDIRVGEVLREAFGLPVWVDNECRNLVLAEKMFGEGRDAGTFISLMTDYGIGAGIMIDDRLMRGKDDSFGEIGHTTVQMDGLPCTCGNRGCWERYASSNALIERVRSRLPAARLRELERDGELTIGRIGEAVRQGDPLIRELAVEELGGYLAVGIANLVNAINPERVILHGELLNLGDELTDVVNREVQRRALPIPRERVRVLRSGLGPKANLIGSGALVLKELFECPELLFSV